MFEISHADLSSEEGGFHALRIFRSTYNRFPLLESPAVLP
jgi:hypothetical protein